MRVTSSRLPHSDAHACVYVCVTGGEGGELTSFSYGIREWRLAGTCARQEIWLLIAVYDG